MREKWGTPSFRTDIELGPNQMWATRLPLVVMSQSYYYFAPSVPFFQIPDRVRDLTQPVTLVDNGRYLPRRHEIAHDGQILSVHSRNKHAEVLANEA